jgi:hypothetical protein
MDRDALVEESNETCEVLCKIAAWLGTDESLYDSDEFTVSGLAEDVFIVLKRRFGETIPATDEELLGDTSFRIFETETT